jgi:hypothetical protein
LNTAAPNRRSNSTVPQRSARLGRSGWARPSGRALLMAGVGAAGAYASARLPIVTVIGMLAALDAGVLIYWCYFRKGRHRAAPASGRVPMRALAEVMTAAGVLLILTALWVTILGLLTEFGITSETTANWSALAATGWQVSAAQPAAFGLRCLIVAASVWMVGFGLTRASSGS